MLRTLLLPLLLLSFCSQAQTPPKPAAPATRPDAITSIILPEARSLDLPQLTTALRKRLTPQDRFEGVETDKGLLLIKVSGGRALVSLMPNPIPNDELQKVCGLAWYWPGACDAVKGHRAHFLIVLMGTGLPRLDSALLQTRLAAALVEVTPAVAAYWGTNLQSRDAFLSGSENASRENIPTTLWINFRMARETADRFSISTQGMKDFGLMEIEARDVALPGVELFELLMGTATHLLVRGPFISDGDTIGPSPQLRILVRHTESYWNPGEKVYRLNFGAPAPAPAAAPAAR